MRIAIIGAGLGGLATATWLARAGHHVTVYEKGRHPGGRARSTDHAGYRFNLGAHALYDAGPAREHLASLGITAEGVQPDPAGWLLDGDRLACLPVDVGSTLSTAALGPWERLRFAALFARLLYGAPEGTLAELLAGEPEAVHRVVEASARIPTYVNAPDRISARLVGHQLRRALAGVTYLHGGWQALVDALFERATSAGATIRTGARVTGVTDGVEVDGEHVDADAVVLALPAKAAGQLVELPDRPEAAVAVLDVGLSALPRPEHRFVIGVDQPTYLSVHAARGLAPAGGHSVQLLYYRPPGDTADRRPELEALLDEVQPGWRDHVDAIRYLPRMVAQSAIPSGSDSVVLGDRLYAVGDWVLADECLADGVLQSARRVADALVEVRVAA